jgi:hypothetical protein
MHTYSFHGDVVGMRFFCFRDKYIGAAFVGLVVRVSVYSRRGPGFDSRRYHIFLVAVGLEQGLLSLMRINEEVLERNVALPV